MGFSVLELVLRRLREENFTADVAYPGQKYPEIDDTVAAVHIEKVDRSSLTVTVEVNIISPAHLGGTACEVEALRATEVLRWAGAVCIQNGCTYDGISQVYVVAVLATFTGITGEDSFTQGPGFTVRIGGINHPYAVSFTAEDIQDRQAEYAMGEAAPVGISQGAGLWKITLEELIPAGSPATAEPADAFELTLTTDTKTETFYHCRFTSVKREYTRQGLRRIRTGISMLREDS